MIMILTAVESLPEIHPYSIPFVQMDIYNIKMGPKLKH